ncbi:MAG: nuclear transport factor 2 family protein, partial [Gammaproteobacteria bacterium]|nr:nuclear transport factor 2 family protein [Gammaproteobacteria bacterium]
EYFGRKHYCTHSEFKRGLFLNGCASATARLVTPERMHTEIETFLHEWNAAIAAQDRERIHSAYVNDGRLRWFEDGSLRYRSPDEILHALQQFPAGTQIDTALWEIYFEPLSDDTAFGSAFFQTRLLMPGGNFEFSGVFTMLVERQEHGWAFVTGHTSTHQPVNARR